jgi:uncharacterized coiled-coil protein SlyX
MKYFSLQNAFILGISLALFNVSSSTFAISWPNAPTGEFNGGKIGDILYPDNTNKRIGIGTGTPSGTLEVVGTGGRVILLADSANGGGACSGGQEEIQIDSTGISVGDTIDGEDIVSVGVGYICTDNTGISWNIGEHKWWKTPGSEMVVDTNGNIGVGNPSPSKKLDVNGDIQVSNGSDICVEGGVCLSSAGGKFVDGTDLNDAVYKGGNVGIGLDVPTKTLDVDGDINFNGNLYQNGSPFAIEGGDPSYGSSGGSPDDAVFVNNSGNVGIGTTSPGQALHVGNGDVSNYTHLDISGAYGYHFRRSRGNASSPADVQEGDDIGHLMGLAYRGGDYRISSYINLTTDGAPGADFVPGKIGFYTTAPTGGNPAFRMVIDNEGNVGIGNSNPSKTLDVDGDIQVSSGNDICIEGGNCLSSVSGGGGELNIEVRLMQYLDESSRYISDHEIFDIDGETYMFGPFYSHDGYYGSYFYKWNKTKEKFKRNDTMGEDVGGGITNLRGYTGEIFKKGGNTYFLAWNFRTHSTTLGFARVYKYNGTKFIFEKEFYPYSTSTIEDVFKIDGEIYIVSHDWNSWSNTFYFSKWNGSDFQFFDEYRISESYTDYTDIVTWNGDTYFAIEHGLFKWDGSEFDFSKNYYDGYDAWNYARIIPINHAMTYYVSESRQCLWDEGQEHFSNCSTAHNGGGFEEFLIGERKYWLGSGYIYNWEAGFNKVHTIFTSHLEDSKWEIYEIEGDMYFILSMGERDPGMNIYKLVVDGGSASVDNQSITHFSLNGTDLELTLENDANGMNTVDLSSLSGGGSGDDLGNHTATQNIILGNHYLSGDGGNEGIFVDGTGEVGIGKTNPSKTLDVDGDGRFTGKLTLDKITFPNTDGTNGQVLKTNGSGILSWANDASGSGGDDLGNHTATQNIILGNHYLSGDGGNEGILIDNSGKVKVENLQIPDTTASDEGILYKNGNSFLHNFHHPTGGTHVPIGQNTFIGEFAGNFSMGSTTTKAQDASYNTGVGYAALQSNTNGHSNTALGANALPSSTTGNQNTAIGTSALLSNTTGYLNTATGSSALRSNTTGAYNAGHGTNALRANTTGTYNAAHGLSTLFSNTTGSFNAAHGGNAMRLNINGNDNSAHGAYAMYDNVSGSENTATGKDALRFNENGNQNVVIGVKALQGSNVSGNVAVGYMAGYGAQSDYNTTIGYKAGGNLTTGSNNILIGKEVNLSDPTLSNKLNIGNTLYGDLSLGRVGIKMENPSYDLHVNGSAGKPGGGSWMDSSDRRLKKNIQNLSGIKALEKLTTLQGISFEWIHPEEHDSGTRFSFVAQDLEKVFPNWVKETAPSGKDSELIAEGEKVKNISFPHDFNAFLIEGIKELKNRIDALWQKSEKQTEDISTLFKIIEKQQEEIDLLKNQLQALQSTL